MNWHDYRKDDRERLEAVAKDLAAKIITKGPDDEMGNDFASALAVRDAIQSRYYYAGAQYGYLKYPDRAKA